MSQLASRDCTLRATRCVGRRYNVVIPWSSSVLGFGRNAAQAVPPLERNPDSSLVRQHASERRVAQIAHRLPSGRTKHRAQPSDSTYDHLSRLALLAAPVW
jgi:hypothetical protein